MYVRLFRLCFRFLDEDDVLVFHRLLQKNYLIYKLCLKEFSPVQNWIFLRNDVRKATGKYNVRHLCYVGRKEN